MSFEDQAPDDAKKVGSGVLAPVIWGFLAFVAAGISLSLVLHPGALDNDAGKAPSEAAIARLIEELKADRAATSARLDAVEREAGLITGSIPDKPGAKPAATADGASLATTFGADLGRSASVRELRQRWTSLVARDKSLALREARLFVLETANSQVFSLLVGPFTNAADAATLCARLADVAPNCIPTPFEGQKLQITAPGGL